MKQKSTIYNLFEQFCSNELKSKFFFSLKDRYDHSIIRAELTQQIQDYLTKLEYNYEDTDLLYNVDCDVSAVIAELEDWVSYYFNDLFPTTPNFDGDSVTKFKKSLAEFAKIYEYETYEDDDEEEEDGEINDDDFYTTRRFGLDKARW